MPTKVEAADAARHCRVQAALTTSAEVRDCLLEMADQYEAEAVEPRPATLRPDPEPQ